jgi:hypothetical protein
MKFLAKWKIEQDKWLPILNKWISMTPQERANAGDGVKIIGRWHDTAARTGAACLAKLLSSSICLSANGRTSWR